MKSISSVLFLVVLSACATSEDPKSKDPPGQVTVYREPSSRDSFFPMLFTVDGRPVATLHPDDERSLEIAPGAHRFAYELGVYSCATDVRIESGKSYLYRLAHGCIIELDDGTGSGEEGAEKGF